MAAKCPRRRRSPSATGPVASLLLVVVLLAGAFAAPAVPAPPAAPAPSGASAAPAPPAGAAPPARPAAPAAPAAPARRGGPAASTAPAGAAGHWEGVVEVLGSPLVVLVDLVAPSPGGGGAWSGTIDIPAQGAKGLPLAGISVAAGKVRFSIRGVAGSPTFDGTLGSAGIQGTFTQGMVTAPFHLGRERMALPQRPQEPVPPLPYAQREVAYDNGPIHLAGTLTVPEGRGPFPAVLLIAGSGAHDRNEEVFGHRPFLVLADHLTRADIAVLRVDGRGVGGSTGDTGSATLADRAGDALAGVRFLAAQPEIAKDRIGLLGHSEGGLVAALAASQSRDVAFVVMLGASGVPGYDLLPDQVEALTRARGAPEATVKQLVGLERQALDAVRAEKDEAALRAKLAPILRAAAELAAPQGQAAARDLDGAVEQQVKAITSPWFRSFVAFDPRPVLAKLRVPVLAVGGGKDTQVPAARNLQVIERALQRAPSQDVTIRMLPNLNHLFQPAKTGSPAEYAAIEETMDPDLLGIITRWILARFGGRPGPALPATAPPPT
jgi:uncharacterized protein